MAISMEEIVQVLQSRIGNRWEGIEVDGRDEMVRVLKKEFGVGSSQADEIIDGLIRAGTIRYHHQGNAPNENEVGSDLPVPPVIPTPGIATGGTILPAVPLVGGSGGYWQIGSEGLD